MKISKICVIWVLFFVLLTACGARQTVSPAAAQARVQSAWGADWHGTWELQWQQMPLNGSVVFEGWVSAGRTRRRYELLEAPSPALVGLVYVNDGSAAVIFNRLEESVSATRGDAALSFSPVTDALARVDRVLAQPPQTVSARADGGITRYTFGWANGHSVKIWLDEALVRVVRIEIRTGDDSLTLAARTVSPLGAVPPGLFAVPGEN